MTKLIAEIGVNAGGSVDRALHLIELAANAGADLVKFQKREPRVSTPRHMWDVPKETPWGTVEPYIEYREKAEFDKNAYIRFSALCDSLGIRWFASAWDKESVDFLDWFNTPYIKIPSALATDSDLIDYAMTKNSVIVSTGMCDNVELMQIGARIPQGEGHWLFVCHSEYPVTDDRELNLRQITNYIKMFPGIGVGFSSHSTSPYPAIYSKFYGAEMVEVHITENRGYSWGDNPASLEPDGVELIARELKRIDRIAGDGLKRLYPSELAARKKLRGV